MATVSSDTFREQLHLRRHRLVEAARDIEPSVEISDLLQEVDLALGRLQKGSFGVCELCNGGIEADALLSNPTIRLCLDHLTSDQRRTLEHDLELAHQIQHRLLPQPFTQTGGWEIHYHYQPAGLVSGDYCDLIFPQNGNGDMIFLVGDVSGKGVAAAMLMTQLHAMFRTLVSVGLPLKELLASANQVLTQSTLSGQFATLMAGRASDSGEVELAGAGHVPALLVRESGVTRIPATGLPLGLFPGNRYQSQQFHLESGDSLVLYSDGLSEANDDAGGEYGEVRLSKLLSEKRAHRAQEITSACLDDLKIFCGGTKPVDDLTLMVIQRAH
jgi:sigma-B regulation protein RsbU (phosphoserine phosphatase)